MESSQVPESFSRRGEGREISVAVEAVHHRGERVCTLLLVHSQSWVIAELSSSRRSFLSLQTRVGISSCTLCLLKLLPFFALSFSFLLLFPPSTRRGGVWISSLDFNRHRRYDALIINTDLYRRLISSPSLHFPPPHPTPIYPEQTRPPRRHRFIIPRLLIETFDRWNVFDGRVIYLFLPRYFRTFCLIRLNIRAFYLLRSLVFVCRVAYFVAFLRRPSYCLEETRFLSRNIFLGILGST